MSRREKTLRTLFGFALALATFLTRFPIRAKTFFEFDSINFAVGTFRFDLHEVTPQMPGYILHVLFGRLMYWVTGDLTLAYVWGSILLSIGAVLFLWRAAAVLRGERVGVIAALLWLTLPIFWFHGAVASIYAEEAFYTSLLLYLGLKWLRSKKPSWEVILYFAALSLATGARQTSILFFFPATIFLFVKRRPSKKIVTMATAAFVAITAAWLFELLREAGGLSSYLALANVENNFKTQSILFGNSWQSQFDLVGKVLFYFVIALGPTWLFVLTVDVVFARRSVAFVRKYSRNTAAQFVVLVALMPMAFYLIVFFMKAGYLLNVLPSAILARAVLLDQAAIWIAQGRKERTKNKNILTRPIIMQNVAWLTGSIVALNILWFFIQWPGTQQKLYNNEDTRNSFIHGAVNRYEHSQSRMLTLANRAFEYTNVSGIRAVDSLNDMTLRALQANSGNDSGEVILASWWYRWSYLLLPHAVTYDLELDPYHPGALWVGHAQELHREFLDHPGDSVIRLHSTHPVLLLLRHDRPDFDEVARQVHLERLPLPEYLDIYKILDSSFVLKWHDRTFISN
ncbi:MAG TPA: glycosyltransferase family 39 protein [Candidatus Kapabacteria bacterium]|nr:glycosyltransferase family 39 protein [Candidatus Kapabacteria bacterium]